MSGKGIGGGPVPGRAIGIDRTDVTGRLRLPYRVREIEGCSPIPPNPHFEVFRWHDELELVYVLEGGASVDDLDRSIVIGRGEGAFVNRQVIHRIRGDERSRLMSLAFPERLLTFGGEQAVAGVVTSVTANPAINVVRLDGMAAELLGLIAEAELGIGSDGEPDGESGTRSDGEVDRLRPYRTLTLLCRLWLAIVEGLGPQHVSPHGLAVARTAAMLHHIAARHAERISLADLATAAGVSKSECARCFDECLGTSPHRYLVEYRLARAAELLVSTDMPVGDVAAAVGFSQQSHFGASFRRRTGLAPLAFRRAAAGAVEAGSPSGPVV